MPPSDQDLWMTRAEHLRLTHQALSRVEFTSQHFVEIDVLPSAMRLLSGRAERNCLRYIKRSVRTWKTEQPKLSPS